MSTVDNRIVHMTFDNAAFERNVRQSIRTLNDLKSALDFSGARRSFEELGRMSGNIKMTLDTTQFTNSLAESQRGIQKITDQLNFGSTHKGFQTLSEHTKSFNLNGMATAISGVSGKFLALSTLAVTALATITAAAVRTGIDVATAFSTDPIVQGFQEMETNMNSIQTILANTASKGTTLDQVNNALQQLNEYSDRTIYNFSQMARNIGTFTAAGVDLDTSVNAIKGIANLAAISGSNSEQASTAMYQLSQALATGSVKLMDWNSVVNAGMGGEVFKNALFETGKALGTIADIPLDMTLKDWEAAGNNFRESLQDGWITADVLTTTLQSFTGDLTEAQLMSLGYTKEQAAEMFKLGKLGNAAATEVKTLTQLLSTVKETMGSGWSRSFQLIFGDFEEAKEMFTGFNDLISEVVNRNADARNDLLSNWKDLGGRIRLIDGVTAAFQSLIGIFEDIGTQWNRIFPAVTGERLFEITDRFATFFESLRENEQFGDVMNNAFAGFFASLKLGIEIVKGVIGVVNDLFQHFTGGGGVQKTIEFIDNLALKMLDLHQALVVDGGLDQFFQNLTNKLISFGEALRDPGALLEEVKQAFKDFFEGIDFSSFEGMEDAFNRVRDKISEVLSSISVNLSLPEGLTEFFESLRSNVDDRTTNSLSDGFDNVKNAMSRVKDIASEVWDVLQKIGDVFGWIWDRVSDLGGIVQDVFTKLWDFVTNIGPHLQDMFMSEEFDQFLNLLDSLGVLLGGRGLQQIGTNLGDFGANFGSNFGFGGIQEAVRGIESSGGIIGSLKRNLDQLTSTLQTMQTQIRANALLDIAKAMALLTASVLTLSFINPDQLAKSLTALAVGMGQLIGALAVLNVSSGKFGLGFGFGLAAMGATMILVATSVLVLSAAVRVLAGLNWDEIARGMTATIGLMGAMVVVAKLMSGSAASMATGAFGMVLISGALVVMGGAMKIFASMSWEEIAKGLTAVAGSLVAIGAAMHLMPLSLPVMAPSLVAIAAAFAILGGAMLIFATMSWEEIGKGMAALAGGLLTIAAALQLMPLTTIINGPALIALASALVILGGALKIFATMSWEEIGKAMTVLGGSLGILALALNLMSGTLAGAAAVGIAAVSLIVLGKALRGFAAISWKELGKGLGVMAIALGAITAAALLMQPATGAILLLAASLLALGAGFALIGVGAALVAEAFQIIAAAGTAGVDVFMYAIDQLLTRLPDLISIFTDGMLQIVQSIVDALPAMVEGMGQILAALLEVVIENIPLAVIAISKFIDGILQVIRDASPDLVRTGAKIILDILHGVEDNITEITRVVAIIITRFLEELTGHVDELVGAGINVILAFIEGIAEKTDDIVGAGVDILENLLLGIAQNIDDIVGAVGQIVTRFIEELAKLHSDILEAGIDALLEFLEGLSEDIPEIVVAVGRMVTNVMDALADAFVDSVDRAAQIVIDFLHDLADVIRENDDALSDAFADLGAAIIEGIIVGLVASAPKLVEKVGELMADAVEAAGKPWEWFSPSHVMMRMGNDIVEGLIIGLDQNSARLNKTVNDVSGGAVDTFQKAIADASFEIQMMNEFNPTITPVLDLAQIRATAGEINGLLNPNALNPGVSLDQANALAVAAQVAQEATALEETRAEVREVKFEQNNYSPEALTTARIYRQTRNLIEVTKKELEDA